MLNDRKRFVGRSVATNRSWRISFLGLCLVLVASGIVVRLYYLQCSEYSRWQQHANSQHSTTINVNGARGEILDSLGRTLATSVEVASVGIHPNRVKAKNMDSFALHLHDTTGIDLVSAKQILQSGKKFAWVKRGLPLEVESSVRSYRDEKVEVFREFKRYYPQEQVAGPVLGKVGRDGNGLSGMELQWERSLKAANVELEVGRDARGRFSSNFFDKKQRIIPDMQEMFGDARMALGAVGFIPSALKDKSLETRQDSELRTEGSTVVLTIDSFIQDIVEKEFALAQESSGAKQVFGLVMDAETGDILALSQVPSFNPNDLAENTASLRNVVLQDSFEPGSTFKPLVAAAALSNNVVKINELMDCENGKFKVGRHTIRDVHGVGVVPFEEVLVRSSNVGMTKVGRRLGAKRLYESLVQMGFGKLSRIELPGEAGGILRNVKDWREVDVATHSFGQGIAVTSLQLVQAYSALANEGLMVTPSLIKRSASERIKATRVFDAKSAREVSDALEQVVVGEHGTGKNAAIEGFRVMGKTGTAQKSRIGAKGYDTNKVLSSFIGYVDGSANNIKRKLIMLVVVDEPAVKPRWGGVLAAPVFKSSMEKILSYLLTMEQNELQTAFATSISEESISEKKIFENKDVSRIRPSTKKTSAHS